jgi:hypothetical protein
MRSSYFLAITAFVAVWLSTAHAQQCDIFGTAPACAGSCPNGYLEQQRVDDGCKTGSKAYCCKWPPEHTAPPQGFVPAFCHWFGTGPLCAGSCPAGWKERGRKSDGCLTGSRVDCCDERSYCPAPHGTWAVCKAQQNVMTWPIKNNSARKIEVRFFARGRHAAWPEAGRVFAFDPGQARDIAIHGCIDNEQVCFGAWVAGELNGRFWGVGPDGKQGCKDCCHSCKEGKVKGNNLDK